MEAGLRSNRLTDALVSAGDFARTLLGMQHQIRSALVYPLLIFAIAYGFFLLLLDELVPRLLSLLAVSGGSPHVFLKLLQLLSRTMVYWGPAVPAAIFVFAIVTGDNPDPSACGGQPRWSSESTCCLGRAESSVTPRMLVFVSCSPF